MGPLQYAWEPARTVEGSGRSRRKRLAALGNAVVPQVAYEVLMALLAVMDECREVA